jgi:hypothetical protein
MLLTRGAGVEDAVTWAFRLSLGLHLLMVLGEASMGHPTAHAALAARAMTRGRYAHFFWGAITLGGLALFFSASTPAMAAIAGLGSLLFYEHAFVQAGQSVPLA